MWAPGRNRGWWWPTAVIAVFGADRAASGQPWVTYDAGLGTLPQDQCFEQTIDAAPVPPQDARIEGGALFFSTLDLQATGSEGGALWWQREDVEIDLAAGVTLEARVRIVDSQYRTNPGTGWPRPGYTLAVYDRAGRLVWIGIGSERVFLSNTAFGQFGTVDTVDMAFDSTDGYHTYRIDAGPGGASLTVDGVPRLSLPRLGPVEAPQAHGLAYFGDPTYWANSAVYTAWFRFSGVAEPCCRADLNGDGLVDFSDYLEFLNLYDAGDPRADFNHDGLVDFSDYLEFLNHYDAGC